MTTVAIRVEGLGKSYKITGTARPGYRTLRESIGAIGRRASRETFWALRDVSFEIGHGEAVGIIGRNGAGKSTLLKILSRITSPTTGRAEVSGRLGSLLEVGTGFHPELTGRENVYLNGAILGMRRAEISARFDEIVAFAGTEQFLDEPVKHYSSGMMMRLAFAVAAHLPTEVLVVDEVLAVGDAAFQRKCLEVMGDAAGAGRTVLFVSHNMAAIRALCRSAMVLEHGLASPIEPVDDAIRRSSRQPDAPAADAVDRGPMTFHGFELAQGGSAHLEYDGGAPIDLRLRFALREDARDFRIGVEVRDEVGGLVARALLADWDPTTVDVAAGEYVLSGAIPAGLLAGGNYTIEPHASTFDVADYELGAAFGQSIAVIAPAGFNASYPRERSQRLVGTVAMRAGWSLKRA